MCHGTNQIEDQRARPPSFEIVRDEERFLSLRSDWNELSSRSADSIFSQSYQWCSVAWNCSDRPAGRQLFCLVGWLDNRVILIWPFVILRRGLWRMLRPLGSLTTEYSDLLVEDNPEADRWSALAWRTLRNSCNSDIILLPFVLCNSRLQRTISRDRAMSSWAVLVSSVHWAGYQSWDGYYKSLRREFRYSLRNRRRRLSQNGNLSFDHVKPSQEVEATLDWLFQHKSEWLSRKGEPAPWEDASLYRQLLIRALAEKDGIGGLTLFVLKLDGKPVAAVLVRISRHRLECMIAAYDKFYSTYGPGQLLYENILQWALPQGLEVDFRLGCEGYKRYWTNRESKAITYRFTNSLWGSAFALASQSWSYLRSFYCHKRLVPRTELKALAREAA